MQSDITRNHDYVIVLMILLSKLEMVGTVRWSFAKKEVKSN